MTSGMMTSSATDEAPAPGVERSRGLEPPASILQLGLGWFPEAHGGAENVLYHLDRHLPAFGCAVRSLVVGSPEVATESGGRAAAFAPPTAALPRRLAAARAGIHAALRRHDPDIVASHFALTAVAALSVLRERPHVVHFHGPWALESAVEGGSRMAVHIKGMIERSVYGRADRFVVLSRAFGAILRDRYGVPEHKIELVEGGVDARRFAIPEDRRQARLRLGWPQDRQVVVTVRRLVRRMGLSELLSAMVEVSARNPDALLMIIGKGPEARALQEGIRALRLENHVRLLGFVPDELLPLAYRAADLSVMPSQSLEGFGITVAESLAAGTPVLVTPVGGLPDVVGPLDGGLVLGGCGERELAAGIADALQGRRRLPGQDLCQRYARQRFDWPVIAEKILRVYQKALH
ncbi:glycosyltransferase family 4 protein [Azospirillum sp. SYSU D00513]|uniref:glycosyltransferase family 4 protein n=1 Tax=Azospirillum sp. SYSU D00513 TaxID=2812561 RepID=UPI001FFFAE05|nr:glycosyltransferase family 4 protein [Azospirillum sp. SYSU D00513]